MELFITIPICAIYSLSVRKKGNIFQVATVFHVVVNLVHFNDLKFRSYPKGKRLKTTHIVMNLLYSK